MYHLNSWFQGNRSRHEDQEEAAAAIHPEIRLNQILCQILPKLIQTRIAPSWSAV
jgi:hypothetical protein